MTRRLAALALALGATAANAQMSCDQAVTMLLTTPVQVCQKQCNGDGPSEGLPGCGEGQEERSPESCGNDDCGHFFESIDDAAYDMALQGLAACEGHPYFDAYTIYATMQDGAYLKTFLMHSAAQCGHSDKLALSGPPVDSCEGAVLVLSLANTNCAKKCVMGEDAHPRRCMEGEEEHDAASCGDDGCQSFLARVKAGMDDLKAGLMSCAEHPDYATYAQYEPMMAGMFMGLASNCGFDYEHLPEPEEKPEVGERSCVRVPRHVYDEMVANGKRGKLCQ